MFHVMNFVLEHWLLLLISLVVCIFASWALSSGEPPHSPHGHDNPHH